MQRASGSIHVAGYLYQGLCSREQANHSFSPMQPDGSPSSGTSAELNESCEPICRSSSFLHVFVMTLNSLLLI